jgi:hypothetical protein
MQPCPFLPKVNGCLGVETTRRHGAVRGEDFYLDALRYAQSQWLSGKPAQAILQLNKALSANLDDDAEILRTWPWPYPALEWILENAADGSNGFMGNPVRHFQHLATRMSGARREVRIERAWKCFHIARRVLQEKGDFPMDGRQMAREGIFIPGAS